MIQPTPTSNSVQLADALAEFFNVPTLSEKEAAFNYQAAIRISGNAKERVQVTFTQLPNMVEVGPRMTLGRVEWEKAK
jgi:transketolase N-terminal domain/subunit